MKFETIDGRKVCPIDHYSVEYGERYREINAEIREAGPVVWSDKHGGFWFVADYQSCRQVLQDSEAFTLDLVEGAREFGPILPMPREFREMAETPGMLFVEGERHDVPRAALSGPFSKRRIAAKADMIRSHVDRVLDEFLPRGEFDIVHDVAMQFVAGVTNELIGLELEDPASIFRAMQGPSNYVPLEHEEGSEQVVMSTQEALAYVGEVVRARREEPRDDMISILLQANGGQFSDEEVEGMVLQVIFGALENPQTLIGHCMVYLEDRPDLRAQLRANPSQISDFVLEALRNLNPAMTGVRTAARDVELGGMQIRKGDRVVLSLAAANADPAMFDSPDEFDFERGLSQHQHIAFGAGIHHCLGSHLVEAMVPAVVQGLLERIEDYSFDKVVRNTEKAMNDMFDRAWMRVTALRAPDAQSAT